MTASTTTTPKASAVQAAVGAVGVGLQATEAYGRPDLSLRLVASRKRLADPDLTVLVVGEFKQGKSTLINSLLGVDVCPVDDDVSTAVPTVVSNGTKASAVAVIEADEERQEIDIQRLVDWVSEAGNPGNYKGLRAAEVRIPSELLGRGLALVDTPGVGGLDSVHGVITLGALPMAEAVIFVSDASQELSRPELDFLRRAHETCPNVVFVQTKTDLYPAWREIVARNESHLAAAGLDIPIVAGSSLLRREAIRLKDRELNAESGYPVLLNFLNDNVLASAGELAVRAAQADLRFVTDQLASTFEAELAAMEDPETVARLSADLEAAQQKVAELRSTSARWQQTLNDGIQDLTADVDHDLRGRTRKVNAEAEAYLDDADPAEVWTEYEHWLRQRVTADMVTNYQLLASRSETVAERVAEHFAIGERQAGMHLAINTPQALLDQLADPNELDLDKQPGAGDNVLTAVRGSYGGMLMFSMLGGMIGLGAFGPLSLVFGAGLGRKSLREDKKRQLATRQHQSKTLTRKYVDEAMFVVGKDSRDSLRRIQRQLRDHFTARAEELQQSTSAALAVAKEAMGADEQERTRRQRIAQTELQRIAQLRERVEAL